MQTIKDFWSSLSATNRTVAIIVAGLIIVVIILTSYDLSWVLEMIV